MYIPKPEVRKRCEAFFAGTSEKEPSGDRNAYIKSLNDLAQAEGIPLPRSLRPSHTQTISNYLVCLYEIAEMMGHFNITEQMLIDALPEYRHLLVPHKRKKIAARPNPTRKKQKTVKGGLKKGNAQAISKEKEVSEMDVEQLNPSLAPDDFWKQFLSQRDPPNCDEGQLYDDYRAWLAADEAESNVDGLNELP